MKDFERYEKIEELEERLLHLKQIEGFPLMCCNDAVLDLAKTFGFRYVSATYHGPFDDPCRKEILNSRTVKEFWRYHPADFDDMPHTLAYDPSSLVFVDLTARQFSASYPEIFIMDWYDPRIVYDSEKVVKNVTSFEVRGMYVVQGMKEDGRPELKEMPEPFMKKRR